MGITTTGEGDLQHAIGKRKNFRRLLSSMAISTAPESDHHSIKIYAGPPAEGLSSGNRAPAQGNGGVTARLDEQAAQIQKVSAQLDVSKTARQTVLNNQ